MGIEEQFGEIVIAPRVLEKIIAIATAKVDGVDKEMIWHDFTRFAAFPHGCVQGRFDGTMSASHINHNCFRY